MRAGSQNRGSLGLIWRKGILENAKSRKKELIFKVEISNNDLIIIQKMLMKLSLCVSSLTRGVHPYYVMVDHLQKVDLKLQKSTQK